mgnify:CR=1 FL=1
MLLDYNYQIDQVSTSIAAILVDETVNPIVEEEFELLDIISNDQMLFRYLLTENFGDIKVLLTKKGDGLAVKISLSPKELAFPVGAIVAAILSYIGGDMVFSVMLVITAVIWTVVVYFLFYWRSCRNIKDSLTRYIKDSSTVT